MIKIRVKKLERLNKTIGLIGEKKAYPVFFKTRFGIHTFGMRFPIDVLILDKKNNVVKITENIKPNKFHFWDIRYNNVLELPENTIKKYVLKRGEKIKLDII